MHPGPFLNTRLTAREWVTLVWRQAEERNTPEHRAFIAAYVEDIRRGTEAMAPDLMGIGEDLPLSCLNTPHPPPSLDKGV